MTIFWGGKDDSIAPPSNNGNILTIQSALPLPQPSLGTTTHKFYGFLSLNRNTFASPVQPLKVQNVFVQKKAMSLPNPQLQMPPYNINVCSKPCACTDVCFQSLFTLSGMLQKAGSQSCTDTLHRHSLQMLIVVQGCPETGPGDAIPAIGTDCTCMFCD